MSVVVGVDLGGTKTAAALVDRDGGTGPVVTVPTPATEGPARVLDVVADLVRETAAGRMVSAVGVGTAGVVDAAAGTITSATDALRDWVGAAVGPGLSDRLRAPVAVDNDVNAHALGEHWRGAARGADHILMVTVGTGVGGALIVDGLPWRGRHHVAGEIGHVPVPGAEGLRCGCGRPGHLEAIASGPGLVRHLRAIGGSEAADAREVVALASAGDHLARRALDEAARALGRCLAGVVTVLDPDVVVVGGGLADASRAWWEAMEQAMRADLLDVLHHIPLARPELGARAAIVGAARLAWRAIGPGADR